MKSDLLVRLVVLGCATLLAAGCDGSDGGDADADVDADADTDVDADTDTETDAPRWLRNCQTDDECAGGEFCFTDGYAHGVCSRACASAADCGEEGNCVFYRPFDTTICLQACGGDRHCAAGPDFVCDVPMRDKVTTEYVPSCMPASPRGFRNPGEASGGWAECPAIFLDGLGVCGAVCQEDADCPAGFVCGVYNDLGTTFGGCWPEDYDWQRDYGEDCNLLECPCLGVTCSRTCVTQADCPGDDACLLLWIGGSNEYQGYCGQPSGQIEDGGPCTERTECRSGYCTPNNGSGYCFSFCRDDQDCADGYTCKEMQAYGRTYQACLVEGHTTVASGEPCTDDHECQSGYCVETSNDDRQYCRTPCTGDPDCGAGEACIIVVNTAYYGQVIYRLCLPDRGLKGAGAPCTDLTECASGLCLLGTCGSLCTESADCPAGYRCENIYGGSRTTDPPIFRVKACITQDAEVLEIGESCGDRASLCPTWACMGSTTASQHYCQPHCRRGDDCGADASCNAFSSHLVCNVHAGPADIGEPCSSADDCRSGACLASRCSEPCFADADCPADARCDGIEIDFMTYPYCVWTGG